MSNYIKKVFDTSALMTREWTQLFNSSFLTIIPTIVLEELEHLKTGTKNIDSAIAAQQVIKYLSSNKDKWIPIIFKDKYLNPIIEKLGGEYINNDLKILSCALAYDTLIAPDETVFVTNDLSLSIIANLFFGEDSIESIEIPNDKYTGYKEINPTEAQLEQFYTNPNNNLFELLNNEYLILKNKENKVIDVRRWSGEKYEYLKNIQFSSVQLGTIAPYKGDIYQKLAFDSLVNNQIVMLRGAAGSGKSLLALGYLFQLLETNKIDKIIIFCNTVAARNAARLGLDG